VAKTSKPFNPPRLRLPPEAKAAAKQLIELERRLHLTYGADSATCRPNTKTPSTESNSSAANGRG
jgi:hypothetical protein